MTDASAAPEANVAKIYLRPGHPEDDIADALYGILISSDVEWSTVRINRVDERNATISYRRQGAS